MEIIIGGIAEVGDILMTKTWRVNFYQVVSKTVDTIMVREVRQATRLYDENRINSGVVTPRPNQFIGYKMYAISKYQTLHGRAIYRGPLGEKTMQELVKWSGKPVHFHYNG